MRGRDGTVGAAAGALVGPVSSCVGAVVIEAKDIGANRRRRQGGAGIIDVAHPRNPQGRRESIGELCESKFSGVGDG